MFNFFMGQDEPAEEKAAVGTQTSVPFESAASEQDGDSVNSVTIGSDVPQPSPEPVPDNEDVYIGDEELFLPSGKSKKKKDRKPEEGEPDIRGKYGVMSAKNYFWSIFVMFIPVVGWLVAMVWALGLCKNRNRRNLSRAVLICIFIQLALAVILYFAAKWFLIPNLDDIINSPKFVDLMNKLGTMLNLSI